MKEFTGRLSHRSLVKSEVANWSTRSFIETDTLCPGMTSRARHG